MGSEPAGLWYRPSQKRPVNASRTLRDAALYYHQVFKEIESNVFKEQIYVGDFFDLILVGLMKIGISQNSCTESGRHQIVNNQRFRTH
ncbi:hypothetical protein Zmor_010212 [Zophobas morio]|uniref:Uncharacterized protein n=1 Tax=Zophobas morio TaxID=2755281 RepID=A0AA38MJQ0_9CUCU|nr:hypothetical protein Zmor_010212 [Zophobas morio]